MMGVALSTQWICSRLWRLPRFDPRSPLISGLSLCLLLRTNHLWLAAAAAAVTIASKFVLRRRGKHIFNPTNFGLVVMMLVTGQVWVSPGQWGSAAFFAFLMACLGGLVVNRAARSDVTYAFAACYVALVVGRSLWLGEPMAIPLHRLQSGALLLFTFFMISDPKTTPDSRAGRAVFAALVATGAYGVQFGLFRTNGLLWALAAAAPLVPLIDWCLPGARYRWDRPDAGRAQRAITTQGVTHATSDNRPLRGPRPRLVDACRTRVLRLLRSES
jgi:Na+-transporting NADH:ubiquinone oxidoreductase subunit NqrB